MIYKKERKPNFRMSEVSARRGKHQTSLQNVLLVLTLGLVTSPAFAKPETMTLKSVEDAVSKAYEDEINHIAALRNWPKFQFSTDIRVPPSAVHLPRCQSELVIEGRDNQSLPIGNLRRTVSCEDGDRNWRLNVSLKTSLTLPVVVAKHNLRRGETVTPLALSVELRTLTRNDPFFTKISHATDYQTARRIRTGHILNPDKLIAVPLIEKGNEVVVIASKNGFSASTKGVALESGKKGEQIDVQNHSSNKVVRAIVTGLNQVHTQF
ncbi:flagellar basal body P-ring formation chaperone FlgA [Grimontia marina]|uniref:Flagella basal body P-ring formation protein FlgA n=1 Tax=Grimontia marina TaxID=646534 RepID=A0A128FBC5_9GAMM|nr:flagellar basal body P-ring formation chaperone FlgA [Grimontia marina]CZF84117.1 flagellar basal body P-ring biosynthesis protein FlgA [Grimontia marina]